LKIVIIGGAGFIGSNLALELVKQGHQVVVIDNLSAQVHGEDPSKSYSYNLIKDKVQFVKADITTNRAYNIFKKTSFDSVIFLAAETGTGQSMYQAKKYCDTNISGLALFNDLICNKKIKVPGQIVLSSSRAVYGDAELDKDGNPISTKEDSKINPLSNYAVTKLAQEYILFSGFKGISVCALRFQNVYGPGQSLNNPYTGILSIFSKAILNKKPIQVFEDGQMSRDFVYIDDIVDAITLCIGNEAAKGKVFNVGTGKGTTVIEVVNTLVNSYKIKVPVIITGEKREGDIRHNFADIKNISDIGFVPKIDFIEGIKRFCNWVKTQQLELADQYEQSLQELREKNLLK